jgi:hypothetical protein
VLPNLREKEHRHVPFQVTAAICQLLAGLLGFAGAAFAEAPNADIRNGMQTPPPTTSASRW